MKTTMFSAKISAAPRNVNPLLARGGAGGLKTCRPKPPDPAWRLRILDSVPGFLYLPKRREEISLKLFSKNTLEPLLFFVALLALWEALVKVLEVPDFILPPPRDLYHSFVSKYPIIATHAAITFTEALGGFALSLVLGVAFAVGVVYSRRLQNTLYPLIVILYAMPKSAFAPLMVIWIGYGLLSKIAIAFLVAFFPIVVNTVVGLREVEPELLDLARIYRGSKLDVFRKIRLPNSLPYMFAGIKVALVLSVTGAIVAEFVAANQGLGYLILQANYSLDTAFALVNLLILAVLSLTLFMTVDRLQKKLAPWSAEVRQVEGSF